MKAAFLYGGYENLGVEYLSASLKREGHDTTLIFDPRLFADNYSSYPTLARMCSHDREVEEAARLSDAEVFCFSVVTDDYLWACDLARKVREFHPGRPVIFGGIHPSTVPARVLKSGLADFVIVGEGEEPLARLVGALAEKTGDYEIPGVGYMKDGAPLITPPSFPLPDLDALPWPDKDLFYRHLPYLAKDYRIVASRGCLFSCSYCCNDFLKKLYRGRRPYRARSAENVIEELKEAKKRWDFKRVQFFDDIFAPDREWLRYFSFLYRKEIALPFWCSVSPSIVDDEFVKTLKETGCCEVQMGVQSLNEGLRREILMRRESNEDVKNAIRLFREAEIKLVADNISGIPGEGEEDLVQTLSFYNEHRPSRVSDYALRYYPGTGIVRYAKETGIISERDIEELEEGRGSRSFALGGTGAKDKGKEKLRFLMRFFLSFPKKVNDVILRKRLWRFLPSNPFVLGALLRFVEVLAGNDINAERYVARYLHFLMPGRRRKTRGPVQGRRE